MSVAASLIMLLVGVIASLIVSVRVQLALLTHYPTADWPSVVAGLLAGGVLLAVTVALVLRMRSPRRALILLVTLPTMLLTVGCLSVTHFPRSNFKSDELRAEWYRLHPTLRVALWTPVSVQQTSCSPTSVADPPITTRWG
jgi:cytochrome bd-type quinol oxidase subunit 2